jgi:hypothetical protein
LRASGEPSVAIKILFIVGSSVVVSPVICDQSIRLFCVACIREAADCRRGEVRIQ